MIYDIEFSKEAKSDIDHLKRSEPQAYKKLKKLLIELQQRPGSGTGHPKPLSGDRAGQWSRRINEKHRLVYEIDEEKLIVYILTLRKHYNDK